MSPTTLSPKGPLKRPPHRREPKVISTTVEPRLLARRRLVESETRRRRTVQLCWFLGILAVFGLLAGSLFSPILDVDQVEVDGAKHLSAEQMKALAGVEQGSPLVSVNLRSVRASLMESPWVASATVARRWPGTLEVVVIEETPLANIVGSDGTYLVSTTGRVLEQLAAPEASLATLTTGSAVGRSVAGTGSTEGSGLVGRRVGSALREALVVLDRVPDDLAGQLSTATLSKDETLAFQIPDGAEVRFGRSERIAAKLIAVQAVLSQVELACMKTLDVREPTRPAVGRGPGCPGISPDSSPPSDGDQASESQSPKDGQR